ncbi:sensor domain-containing diguanylate cyclase [Halalkalibacter nanhaiisediminis]|uniref:Diguanylate cyclase (GGDEF)-like protein n=1 Tax=Halalkalibacter nanhaiisediminis TaxID=688079 RepID=A0A562QJK5_9BACI|nr:sensor domain-containing diguanylate cyclase [Halalkalibacter nanhaiisediminis]TWI56947.1 diguanylate cyclase (GGDEF)-like protein [Halalkalibacter nanhaiisediminis]
MDKLLIGNSYNSQFRTVLEEVVSNHILNTTLFESAVFFIASNEQILSVCRVQDIPSSMIEAVNYFQNHFSSEKLKHEYEQSLLLAVPILNINESNPARYIGAIVPLESEDKTLLEEYLEGIASGMNLSQHLSNAESELIKLKDLLKEADYQIEFTSLANALVQLYERNEQTSGKLLIVEKSGDHYVPLFHQSELQILPVKEAVEAYSYVEATDADHLFFLKDIPILGNGYNDHLVFLLLNDKKIVSLFLFSFQSEQDAMREKEKMNVTLKEIAPLLQKGYAHEKSVREGQRSDILFQVTKKFYSTMNIGEVLGEILYAMEKAYPHYHVHLLLSQEWEVSAELRIKPFMYGADSGNRKAEHAYLTGNIQVDDNMLYVPLRGKQGVYGVMEIQTAPNVYIPSYEIDFIQMLADTGGNALENAELYQQSRNLIHDLQLINETSHQINLNLRLADTINFMTQQIIESFQAEQVGFIMFPAKGESVVLDGSTPFFINDETLSSLDPFIRKVKRDKDPVYIGDTRLHEEFQLEEYKSVLTVPMIQNNELKGMVITIHRDAYHFTFENFKLLQSLVHHSTLAFTNSMLHEELERLVITDHLTKLYSRNHLDKRIQDSMNQDIQGTFLLLDIDNFKQINDTYGHQVGDDIIIQVSNIMKKNIRDEDIAARWGGEELAIYFPKIEVNIGNRIAKRIVEAVSVETSPKVTVSVGVSSWHAKDADLSLKRLFNLTDEALYSAKEAGKNQVVTKMPL